MLLCCYLVVSGQIGGSCHDAEMHLVHTSEALNESSSNVLVVGVFLDAREYGLNVEVGVPRSKGNSRYVSTSDIAVVRFQV